MTRLCRRCEVVAESASKKILHGVPKQLQPIPFLRQSASRPLRVLRREHVAFGVRHEAEDAAAGVAEAGDVALGAVGIDRIWSRLSLGIDVAKHDLPGLFK